MSLFLTIHTRYKDIQWGLFKEDKLLFCVTDESKKVSKQLIEHLDMMLNKQQLTLSDLSFIAAHQGPAPFTTLRVCLATVNGIGFATGLPLIGVNGLETLLDEYCENKDSSHVTVVLLNAFGKDVYYAVFDPYTKIRSIGYAPVKDFLQELKQQHTQPITFLGNGCTLYHDLITELFKDQAHRVPVEIISLESIAKKAYSAWQKQDNYPQDTHPQIMPVYLKDYSTPTILLNK